MQARFRCTLIDIDLACVALVACDASAGKHVPFDGRVGAGVCTGAAVPARSRVAFVRVCGTVGSSEAGLTHASI